MVTNRPVSVSEISAPSKATSSERRRAPANGTAFIASAACRVLQKTCLVRQRHFGACPPSSLPRLARDRGHRAGLFKRRQCTRLQVEVGRHFFFLLRHQPSVTCQGRIVGSVFNIATGAHFQQRKLLVSDAYLPRNSLPGSSRRIATWRY